MRLSFFGLVALVAGITAAPIVENVRNQPKSSIPRILPAAYVCLIRAPENFNNVVLPQRATTDVIVKSPMGLKPRQSQPLGNGDIFIGCFNRRATIQDVHYLQDTGIGPPPAGAIGEGGQTIATDVNNLGTQVNPFSVRRVTRTSTTSSGVSFEWTLQIGPGFNSVQQGWFSFLAGGPFDAIVADALDGLVENGTQSVAFTVRDPAGRIVLVVIIRVV